VSTKRTLARTAKAPTATRSKPSQTFLSPARSLEALDPLEAAAVIGAAADVSLVIDAQGLIEDVALSIDGLPAEAVARWVGQSWFDVVTPESRTKVQALLDAVADAPDTPSRHWRHVNHPLGAAGDFPVMYRTVPLGAQGRVLAVGRDMRALAQLQQRLVDAQHALERDYLRLRDVETRYRLLFDRSADAILILDAGSSRVLEANPAALELFGLTARRLVGQDFGTGLSEAAQRELAALLARVRSTGRSEDLRLRIAAPKRRDLLVSAAHVAQEGRACFIVRITAAQALAPGAAGVRQTALGQVMQRLPDGFVVTDPDGRVLMANAAFVDLVQLAAEEQLLGESIERWLGRPGVDLPVILAALRQQGALRLFNTALHGEHGAEVEVEISGAAVADAEPPCLGFAVRHVGRRLGAEERSTKGVPRSVEQLTQLVGRMPLKDLVRESTDLIEQLCIEAALQLTQDNRASAAEMLGLSRQSLYVKLRRYGMAEHNIGDGA
jgi:transcriptional regulator PpsR